jgi:hypothetical protein
MATNYVPKRKTIEDLNFVQKKKKKKIGQSIETEREKERKNK